MSKITKASSMFFCKHGSKILIGASVISMTSAIVMGVKVTPKYEQLLKDEEVKKGAELKKIEKVKPIVKAYWPSILLAVLSTACTISSHLIEKKHQAVLAAALTASNTALNEFQKKAIEKIGEKKVTEIKDDICKDKIANNPPPNKENIYITNSKNNVLMFDNFSGRYFYSDIESVKRAVNKLNREMADQMHVSVNELYLELGLPEIELGDCLGWHIDYVDGFEEVLSAQITDKGEPCIVVSYHPAPNPDGWFRD